MVDLRRIKERLLRLELLHRPPPVVSTLDAVPIGTGDPYQDALHRYRALMNAGVSRDHTAPAVVTSLEDATALYRELMAHSPGAPDERSTET